MKHSIISSSQHVLVGGIYQGTSEHFILKVDVLEAGNMGEFDEGQTVMWVRASPKWSASVINGPRKDQW